MVIGKTFVEKQHPAEVDLGLSLQIPGRDGRRRESG
jgi:hypothetical protein